MTMVTTDSRTLNPWSEVHRILSNAKALRVKHGSVVIEGPCDISIDEQGLVEIVFANGTGKRIWKADDE